jgi:hypothetical protein
MDDKYYLIEIGPIVLKKKYQIRRPIADERRQWSISISLGRTKKMTIDVYEY